MKITGVKIEKLLLELTSPFRVAFGTITHSENVMIKVTTDEGVTATARPRRWRSSQPKPRIPSLRRWSCSAPG